MAGRSLPSYGCGAGATRDGDDRMPGRLTEGVAYGGRVMGDRLHQQPQPGVVSDGREARYLPCLQLLLGRDWSG